MVQQMEEGRLREDTTPQVAKHLSLVIAIETRKAYALVRNKDGKFHVGGTRGKFTSVGKLFTAGLSQALDWFSHGDSYSSFEDGPQYGREPRDMSEYTVVEYSCIEVERTPADKWMEAHGKS